MRKLLAASGVPAMPNSRCAVLRNVTTVANRDFVLRFKRSSQRSDVTVSSHRNPAYGTGHFALSLFPDDTLFSGERLPLEVVLLIDVSGSQSGWPLDKEKQISRAMSEIPIESLGSPRS